MDALTIASTGLTAQKQRLAVSAGNIANATTGGRVPEVTNPSAPASSLYLPLQANFLSQPGGGVLVDISHKDPAYSVIFDPTSAHANEMGLVAVPNVDYAEEIVNIMQSKALFKANLAVIKTEKEMMGEMLDALA